METIRMGKRNQIWPLIKRGIFAAFALCATIVIYFSSNVVMRTIRAASRQHVVVAQLMPVRPEGMPQLRTTAGQVVYWEASLQALAQECADGLPFGLQVYESAGGLYFYSVSAKIGWLVFAFSIFLVTLSLLFWPLKRTSILPFATISTEKRVGFGVHVTDEIVFTDNPADRHKRLVAQVLTQSCCALCFIIIITLSWGWFWALLFVFIPILVTSLWVEAQTLLIKGLGILLLCASMLLGKAFTHSIIWKDLTAITATPHYVQTRIVSSQAGRQQGVATTERLVDVLFFYEWQDATRYGYISLSGSRMMDRPIINRLQTGSFSLLRDGSSSGRFLTSSTEQRIGQLVSGLGFCFCLVCGSLCLLHGKLRRYKRKKGRIARQASK